MSWSSDQAQWTVHYKNKLDDADKTVTCDFLYFCVGYYDYDQPYEPEFEGRENFKGQIIHPQKWPEDLDYSGKRVVVIDDSIVRGTTSRKIVKLIRDDIMGFNYAST